MTPFHTARRTFSIARGPLLLAAAGFMAVTTASGSHATTQPQSDRLSRTAVSLTIRAAGVDLSGTLTTASPVCGAHRMVQVWRQIGTRGGGDDQRFAQDTTEHVSGHTYRWDTGNTGVAGRFYATVRGTTTCAPASTPTIRATRTDG